MMQWAFFTGTYENKKNHYGAFVLPTLLPHLTELRKVFQAGDESFRRTVHH